ncbi:hypothetical protein [Sphingomonas sp. SRS2]|uniref:hypothetical protein n=1 Tax=Sphingomonas sp. SRS2 TaxID=133190 RepID=UPI0006184DD5|nr:hypothetical protein [Sphingomonas sp. SRS2]KKC27072.1 hypothetical protein WP12_05140 [Sphingomonas sp. SRS2]
MLYEQKGYIITIIMTSDPEDKARSRARLAELLTSAPPRVEDETTRRNRYAWHRASEQERRRMLKDCGWL